MSKSLYRPIKRRFIPLHRIRQIRWEESVLRARAKREGRIVQNIQHVTCHCGSVECLGFPMEHHD